MQRMRDYWLWMLDMPFKTKLKFSLSPSNSTRTSFYFIKYAVMFIENPSFYSRIKFNELLSCDPEWRSYLENETKEITIRNSSEFY